MTLHLNSEWTRSYRTNEKEPVALRTLTPHFHNFTELCRPLLDFRNWQTWTFIFWWSKVARTMIEMFLELSGVVWWMWKSGSTAASLAGLWRMWQRKWWRSGFITFVLWNEPERDSAEHAALSHTYPWLPHLFSYWLTAGAELFLDALYFMFFPTLMGEAHQQHCLLWVTVAIRAVFSTVVIDADHQLCAHTHRRTQ